jgi:hypothetical protein
LCRWKCRFSGVLRIRTATLENGNLPGCWLRPEHAIEELYGVSVMPGVVQPEAVGFKGDGIADTITVET